MTHPQHPAITVLAVILGLATLHARAADAPSTSQSYDVVVYGGTCSGVVAAAKAAQMGKSVALIKPGRHLGGLSSGGLGATDIGNKAAIGGMSRDFYRRLGKAYGQDEAWKFEPHVAEKVFNDLVAENKVPVVKGERLELKAGVRKDGNRIVFITMESGKTFAGKVFIDATYEGDLMAKAGVAYHVGRESNDEFKETLNGVNFGHGGHQFTKPVDPFIKPGDSSSGLLPGVHAGPPGKPGEGDKQVQAYNFRICMTDVKENQVPFPKPASYDPMRYELLLRYMQAGVFDVFGNSQRMPNGKTDTNNNGAVSSDNIGMNYDYPDGDYATRERIFQEHVAYHQGMLWFLANDPRVPPKAHDFMSHWGLCKDEFQDTGGWGHQLYVREARRMMGDYVMTQHDCQGRQVAADPVGLAAYNMDSHNTQRFVDDAGHAKNEGDVEVGVSPYPISYRSIVPKEAECSNLLVPVCLSSTHIAYGSIRMEPVFMVLGQSAATAAVMAIDNGTAVQKVDYPTLKAKLLEDKQVLEWTGPKRVAGGAEAGVDPAKLPGIVVDDTKAELKGEWTHSSATAGYVGSGYIHDGDAGKGEKSAKFLIPVKETGDYDVRMSYSALKNRSPDVPVTVSGFAGGGSKVVRVNEQKPPPVDGLWVSLGTFHFDAGAEASVVVGNAGTTGHVIVDAVRLLPAKK